MDADELEFRKIMRTAPNKRRKPKRRQPAPVRVSKLSARERRRAVYSAYLKTPHWRALRREILARDNHRCRECKSTEHVEVHHLAYERLGHERGEDLVTLCSRCHRTVHRML